MKAYMKPKHDEYNYLINQCKLKDKSEKCSFTYSAYLQMTTPPTIFKTYYRV